MTMFRSLILICLLMMACGPGSSAIGQQRSREILRWPLPPQRPRIEFLYAFSGKEDLGIETSWWKKAIEFVFGGEKDVVRFNRPQAIALRADGRIYVTDPPAGVIHIFDFTKKEYGAIRSSQQFQCSAPVGVAIGPDQRLYVVDSERRTVGVFDGDEKFLFSFHASLNRPTGIFIADNQVFIVDTGLHMVIVFDLDGKELRRFGHRGANSAEFNFPVALCANPADGKQICVVDALNFRLQMLTQTGEFRAAFGKMGDAPGDFGRPKGVAADHDGHVYVTDALYDITQVFDADGRILIAFGGSGSSFGRFSIPSGIAIDANDRIYIVDSGNQRIQVFQYLR